jgi:head-tail adaptor
VTAGRRDQLVTLETATTAQDDYGEEISTWGPIGGGTNPTQEWVAVYYGKGDERRQAAMEQGAQPATFEMLSNATTRALTLKDRITLDGAAWNIQGIAPDTPQRGTIAITATRSA